MNKTVKTLLGISSILALISAIISFIVPMLLGGFIIIALGVLLGIVGIFGEKKIMGIIAIILSAISLLISPTFWFYISSLGNNSVKQSSENKVDIINSDISSENQFLNDLQEAEKQNPDKRKKYAFGIEKLGDGTYNYYPATYEYSNPEQVKEIFSNKGLRYSTGTVNIKAIDLRKVLEINAIEHSNNPKKMEEFLGLLSSNVVKERDKAMKTVYRYSYTQEQAQIYKSEIQELQEYAEFLGVLLP